MPSRTVFIEHRVGGQLTNASSVTLSSEDGTFGIKELDAGTVVVTDGTSVTNPSTGRYEFDFNADNDKVYVVSWRVLTSSSSNAVFSVQEVGPFVSSSQFQAVTETRGIYKQGTVGALKINIADFEGNAINPALITLTIRDSDGDVVSDAGSSAMEDAVPEKINDGFFVFDWRIATDQAVGEYTVVWEYIVDGVSATEKEVQKVIVSKDAADSAFYSGPRYILRESLEQFIICAMQIPVYFEQARPTRDLKTYRFTKDQWNQTPRIRLYRNDRIIEDGSEAEIDYFKGEIKFFSSLLQQDVITADYTFRWFSDRQIDQFIDNGLNMLNSFPPFAPQFNVSTLLTNGSQFVPAVLYGASIDALRTLMLCLQFQESQQFFGGDEAAQRAFSNMESLKQNYEKTWELLLGNKKLGPYPTSRLVVVPEFTLPGGRSRWFRSLFSGGG